MLCMHAGLPAEMYVVLSERPIWLYFEVRYIEADGSVDLFLCVRALADTFDVFLIHW